MKKHKPIILLVVIEILLIFVLYVCGFRITYNPDLINDWEAISAVAAWVSAIATIAIPVVVVLFEHKLNQSERLTGEAHKAVLDELKKFKEKYMGMLEALQNGEIIFDCGGANVEKKYVSEEDILNYLRATITVTQYDVAIHFDIETDLALKHLRKLVQDKKLSETIVEPNVYLYKYLYQS